ncbi:MAG: hypothetical protein ABIH23_35710 [bacterium]
MSTTPLVERDERTVAVENSSYRWAYFFLSFALLIDVVYRGMFRNEAAWDLMALVFVAGGICTMYQARQKTQPHGWAKKAALIALLSAVVGLIVCAIPVMTQAM